MKLKAFVNDINKIQDFIEVYVEYEALHQMNIKEGLATSCAQTDGTVTVKDGATASGIQQALDVIATGKSVIWPKIAKQKECMKAMIAQMKGCPACNTKVDNQEIKDKVKKIYTDLMTQLGNTPGLEKIAKVLSPMIAKNSDLNAQEPLA